MAKGWYTPGTAAAEDCQASSGSYNNSSSEAYFGNQSGTLYRYYGRFQLDIPQGATIDEARLLVYVNQRSGTVNATITAEDTDSAAAYNSNPWNRSVISTFVGWSNMAPSAYWKQSPDIKSVVQAIVNRVGWAANNYLGLRISADDAASGNYAAIIQSNNTTLVPVLLVSWHTDRLYRKFAIAAASADDTWNQDNDSTGRITEATLKAGSDGTRIFRTFARFNIGMHHDDFIDTYDGATLIVDCAAANSTTGFHLDIATIDDESAFPSGSSVYSRSTIPGQTAVQWSVGSWSLNVLYNSPDISNPIRYRVSQADYDPEGTGNEPYIALRLNEGDANAKNEERQIKAFDAADAVPPILVVAYSVYANVSVTAPSLGAGFAALAPVVVTAEDVVTTAPELNANAAAIAPEVTAVRNVNVTIPRPNIASALGNFDVALNELKHCTDCALDGEGNVYIPEQHHRIIKLKKADFSYVDVAGTWGDGDAEFNIPITACCWGDYVFVVDRYNHRVKRLLRSDLSYVDEFGSYGTGDEQFNNPTGITIDGTYIYISDYSNYRIIKRKLSDYSFVAKIGSLGWGNDNFNGPAGLDNDGTYLYVVDSYNNRLHKRLLSDLSFVDMCGNVGSGDGQMAQPMACTIHDGKIFVTDHDNNRIVIWTQDTLDWVGKFGSYGSGDDQFWLPAGIHNDGTYIYVADSNNDRVKIHRLSDYSYVGQVHTFGFHNVPAALLNADGTAYAPAVEAVEAVLVETPAPDMSGTAQAPGVTGEVNVSLTAPLPNAGPSAPVPAVTVTALAAVTAPDIYGAIAAPEIAAAAKAAPPTVDAAAAAYAPSISGEALAQAPGIEAGCSAPAPDIAIRSITVEVSALGVSFEACSPAVEAQGEAMALAPSVAVILTSQAPEVIGQATVAISVPVLEAEAGAHAPLIFGSSAVSPSHADLDGATGAPEVLAIRHSDIGAPAAGMFTAAQAPAVYTQESTVVLAPCAATSVDAGAPGFTGGSLVSAPALCAELSGQVPGIETVRLAEIAAPGLNLALRAYVTDRVPDWVGVAVRTVILAGGAETERTMDGGARRGSDLMGGAAKPFVLIGAAKKEISL